MKIKRIFTILLVVLTISLCLTGCIDEYRNEDLIAEKIAEVYPDFQLQDKESEYGYVSYYFSNGEFSFEVRDDSNHYDPKERDVIQCQYLEGLYEYKKEELNALNEKYNADYFKSRSEFNKTQKVIGQWYVDKITFIQDNEYLNDKTVIQIRIKELHQLEDAMKMVEEYLEIIEDYIPTNSNVYTRRFIDFQILCKEEPDVVQGKTFEFIKSDFNIDNIRKSAENVK